MKRFLRGPHYLAPGMQAGILEITFRMRFSWASDRISATNSWSRIVEAFLFFLFTIFPFFQFVHLIFVVYSVSDQKLNLSFPVTVLWRSCCP